MIDLKAFIARPDSFYMKIALVNGNPVCLFRDCQLDKPGAEMVFPKAPIVTTTINGKEVFGVAPFGRMADGTARCSSDEMDDSYDQS
jgi:hypothetical protein